MEKVLVASPNFSEGNNMEVIDKILDCFRNKEGVVLANWQGDGVYNRFSPCAMGEPEAVRDAMVEAIGVAAELIDMTKHKGQHPRMGATDVVPITPIKNTTLEECADIARQIGQMAAERFNIPIYMYGDITATAPHRVKLADVRKGEFEGLEEKMKDPLWKPDYGPETMHPTAGATLIAARYPMVPLNVNLNTSDVSIAKEIAKAVRFSSGGFRNVMAIGAEVAETGMVQVSMDLTDYEKTSVYTVLESVKTLAAKYGVSVHSCEMGMVPLQVMVNIAKDYLNLHYLDGTPYSEKQIFEYFLY